MIRRLALRQPETCGPQEGGKPPGAVSTCSAGWPRPVPCSSLRAVLLSLPPPPFTSGPSPTPPRSRGCRPAVTSPDHAPSYNTGVARTAFPHSGSSFRRRVSFLFRLFCLFSSFLALLLCGVVRLSPLPTQPSPFFWYPRCCSISLLRPPPPLLHSWCRSRAFPSTSSPQLMAQAALGISAQGNHIPL